MTTARALSKQKLLRAAWFLLAWRESIKKAGHWAGN